MKEFSIEEKAKRYDEAVERARYWEKNPTVWSSDDICQKLFPELKENEDERIRKALIDHYQGDGCICNNEYRIDYKDIRAWLEKQGDKDKLIKELGEYKVKYLQEVIEKHINSMSNKDDERLRKTTVAFLKDFAEQGYENAVECIDWLEQQK